MSLLQLGFLRYTKKKRYSEVLTLKNLDAYKLKWIAIIGMILSHIPYAFWEFIPTNIAIPLSFVGGFTFAIMAYFVAEGYRHTSDLKKYFLRLFIFGLIATPFHILVIALPWLNIMFTIMLSLLVLLLYDKIKFRVLFWLLYVIVIVPISTLYFEFYFIGPTMVLLYHIIRKESLRRVVPSIFAGVCWLLLAALGIWSLSSLTVIPPVDPGIFRNTFFLTDITFMWLLIPFALGTMFVAFLLTNYNGQRGKSMKWTFYVIYPLHFAVLAAIGIASGMISLSPFGF